MLPAFDRRNPTPSLTQLAVAAVIRDVHGKPLGAIDIAALRSRMTPAEMEQRSAPMVMEAAQFLSRACIARSWRIPAPGESPDPGGIS